MQSDDLETIYRRVREEWDEEAFEKLHAHIRALLLRIASKEPGDQEMLVDDVLLEPIGEFKSEDPDDTICFKPVSYKHFKNLMVEKLRRAGITAGRKRNRDKEVPDRHGMGIGRPHGGQAGLRNEGRPLNTGFQDGRRNAMKKENERDRKGDLAEIEKRLIDEGVLTAKHFKIFNLKRKSDLTFAEIADELSIPISEASPTLQFQKAHADLKGCTSNKALRILVSSKEQKMQTLNILLD